jgi:hypothetical protein
VEAAGPTVNYAVVWQPTAVNQLAELWSEADDRAALTRATDHIDAILADRPDDVGESRAGNRRLVIEPPIAVFYEVVEPDKLVRVLRVQPWRPRLP